MKVSVVIATFNGELFLAEQLESISNQTIVPDEVLVSDDGSTDGTLDIVQSWASVQPFSVRVTRNPNRRGYNSNFSYAFSQAVGDLIFPCDQDDIWYRRKLEAMISTAQVNAEVNLFICDAELVKGDGSPTGLSRIGQARSGRFSLDNYVQGACSAVRRSLINFIVPVPSNWAYDSWMHELARRLGVRMVIPEVLQSFRRHSDNATASPTSSLTPASYLSRIKKSAFQARKRQRLDVVKEHAFMHRQLLKRIRALKRLGGCNNLGPADRSVVAAYEICLVEYLFLLRRIAYLGEPRVRRLNRAAASAIKARRLGASALIQVVKDVIFT